jgi:hypothetical protein
MKAEQTKSQMIYALMKGIAQIGCQMIGVPYNETFVQQIFITTRTKIRNDMKFQKQLK